LTLFTIIISIGPWSVYQLPEMRQFARLKNNLIVAYILQNEKIILPNKASDIDKALGKEIYNGISYLCDFDNCKSIKSLFSEQYEIIASEHKKLFEENKVNEFRNTTDLSERGKILKREYSEMTPWEILASLTTKLKIEQNYSLSPESDKQEFIEVYINSKNSSFFPIELGDYEIINDLRDRGDTILSVRILPQSRMLEVLQNGKVIEKTSLKAIEDKILQKVDIS